MAKRKKSRKNSKVVSRLVIALIIILVVVIGVLLALYFTDNLPESISAPIKTIIDSILSGKDPSTGNKKPTQNIIEPSGIAEGDLVVQFIDVGQGDCIYIRFPDGDEMLIDAGNASGSSGSSEYKDSMLSILDTLVTDDRIEHLMLTHCDKDHVSYMDEVIANFEVKKFYMPNVLAVPTSSEWATKINSLPSSKTSLFTDKDTVDTTAYAAFFYGALTEADSTFVLNVGDFSITGEGYSLDFYCYDESEWENTDISTAEEKNAISPIGILNCHNKKIVLTGDSNEINEEYWIEHMKEDYGLNLLDCDVLKVGHHGSSTSTTTEFLDFIDCEYAVISCNEDGNTYIHPRQDTLDRIKAADCGLYRTDMHGSVVLVVNASGLTFTTEHTPDSEAIWVGADKDAD